MPGHTQNYRARYRTTGPDPGLQNHTVSELIHIHCLPINQCTTCKIDNHLHCNFLWISSCSPAGCSEICFPVIQIFPLNLGHTNVMQIAIFHQKLRDMVDQTCVEKHHLSYTNSAIFVNLYLLFSTSVLKIDFIDMCHVLIWCTCACAMVVFCVDTSVTKYYHLPVVLFLPLECYKL